MGNVCEKYTLTDFVVLLYNVFSEHPCKRLIFEKMAKFKKSVAIYFKLEYVIENEGKGCFQYTGILNEDVPKVILEHFFCRNGTILPF